MVFHQFMIPNFQKTKLQQANFLNWIVLKNVFFQANLKYTDSIQIFIQKQQKISIESLGWSE